MKILYVEDNYQDADLARRELARLAPHIQMDVAVTLTAAHARLDEVSDYDLVLLDLRLPDGSGLELLATIQDRDLPVVVVILTGSGDEETAVAALKAGADDYIVKQKNYLERLPIVLETAVARFRNKLAHRPRPLRVFYVEHNAIDIDLTQRHLARYAPHIRLEVLHDIDQALQRLPQGPIDPFPCDVILLDYRLPGLNALEMLKIIREERGLDVPVVFVTGQGNEEVAAAALSLGATDYLVKHGRYLFELPSVLNNAHNQTQMIRKQAALTESEARFRRLAENARDIIFRIRLLPEPQFEYISPAVTTITGYQPEEFYANADIANQIIFKEDLAKMTALVAGQIGQELLIPMRLQHKDGFLRWVEISPVLIADSTGNYWALEGIARDITATRLAEETLRLQSAALNAASNAIIIINHELKIQWANPAFTRLTGYTAEEALGCNPGDILRSDLHDEAFYENLEATILAGEIWHGEIINRRKDGTLYMEETTITPLVNAEGEITHSVEIKQDISARKEADADRARLLAQVREQVQRIQQIIETVPEGVLLLNHDGRVVLANPVAENDLSFLAQMTDGDTIEALGDRALAELLADPAEGFWHEIEHNGRIFEAIARPVGESAQPEHWVMVINDVTEVRAQRHYLQIQERLATVGQLAAGIAHDFNNVMAVIVLYAQLLQKSANLSAKSQEHLAMINGQAQHAAKLIQQILDFSRRSPIELLPLNLLPLVKEHVKLLERTLPETITLSLDYQPKDFIIRADPTRLQQALMNLAFNARDAMPHGGTLSFGLAYLHLNPNDIPPLPDIAPGDWAKLEVSDSGSGIPPEFFPHLFEPFFTLKEPGKGTGLGLAQVHGIVKQHGGSIDVNSQVGKGSVFTIYLPLMNIDVGKPTVEMAAGSEVLSGTETILLVEDNDVMRLSVMENLDGLGYRILAAANGAEALDILAKETAVSLLLTDIVMPEMGGLELCKVVNESYPHIKSLLMTGYPLGKDKAELQGEGIAGWIQKPFSIETLTSKIRRALDEPENRGE